MLSVARWTQTRTWINVGLAETSFIGKEVGGMAVNYVGMKQPEREDWRTEGEG